MEKLDACIVICIESFMFAMCIVLGLEILNSNDNYFIKILCIGAIVAVYRMGFTDAVNRTIKERK